LSKKKCNQTIKPNERSFDVSLSDWSPGSFGAIAAGRDLLGPGSYDGCDAQLGFLDVLTGRDWFVNSEL
jgi:hypothetical protein